MIRALLWVPLLLAVIVPVCWTLRYLTQVRQRREWWIDHPEERARRRARSL